MRSPSRSLAPASQGTNWVARSMPLDGVGTVELSSSGGRDGATRLRRSGALARLAERPNNKHGKNPPKTVLSRGDEFTWAKYESDLLLPEARWIISKFQLGKLTKPEKLKLMEGSPDSVLPGKNERVVAWAEGRVAPALQLPFIAKVLGLKQFGCSPESTVWVGGTHGCESKDKCFSCHAMPFEVTSTEDAGLQSSEDAIQSAGLGTYVPYSAPKGLKGSPAEQAKQCHQHFFTDLRLWRTEFRCLVFLPCETFRISHVRHLVSAAFQPRGWGVENFTPTVPPVPVLLWEGDGTTSCPNLKVAALGEWPKGSDSAATRGESLARLYDAIARVWPQLGEAASATVFPEKSATGVPLVVPRDGKAGNIYTEVPMSQLYGKPWHLSRLAELIENVKTQLNRPITVAVFSPEHIHVMKTLRERCELQEKEDPEPDRREMITIPGDRPPEEFKSADTQ
jgi:hypothetical protein